MRVQRSETSRRSVSSTAALYLSCLLILCCANASANEQGRMLIVADTPVTHSLVSMVMGDTGQPALLMQGKASPHDYALRPSEAKNLQSADALIWISRALTPWLARAIQTSRKPVNDLELMSAPETIRLGFRDDSAFSTSHEHHHHNEAEQSDSHQRDDEAAIDPHGWLDPVNGIYWLGLISEKLSELDPANGAQYQRNANAARENLTSLQQSINEQLGSLSQKPFVVFHDSYHYFEERFGIHATAAIALSDAELPGIKRMNKLKTQLAQFTDACVFTEPQFSDRLIGSLTRGMSVSTGSLDPLGTTLSPGPELYMKLLQQIADELDACLS